MRQSDPAQTPLLTPRQLEVLELLAKGLTNREIAGVLGISAGTAKNHVSAVIEALDVTNRTEAAVALQELALGSGTPVPGRETEEERRYLVPGFGGRPAIAVLPFDNLSGEVELEFLCDGLVEELTTRFAAYRWFPVIARNSSFAYKGRSVDVRQASRELGARYLVEGSLRRVGPQLRVTVQFLDGASGEHLWAQRFDRDAEELVRLQDDVVDSIVGCVDPALSRIERVRAARQPSRSAGAWEPFQRGMFHLYGETRESLDEAERFFGLALEIDPHLAPALAGIAQVQGFRVVNGWADDPAKAFATALDAAHRAADEDALDPVALGTLGLVQALSGRTAAARDAFERAIELNPSYAVAHWGLAAARLAEQRVEEARALLEKAMRLSPRDPVLHHMVAYLGVVQLVAGRIEEALALAERSQHLRADQPFGHALAAACCAELGRPAAAREAWARVHEVAPGFQPGLVRLILPAPAAELVLAAWERIA